MRNRKQDLSVFIAIILICKARGTDITPKFWNLLVKKAEPRGFLHYCVSRGGREDTVLRVHDIIKTLRGGKSLTDAEH